MADVIFSGGSGLLVAALSGEIDQHSARGLRESIDRRIDYERPQKLRLNFDAVTFMDSSGIGLIMGRYKRMRADGGTLSLCSLPPQCRRIVEMSGITNLLSIAEDK